MEALQMLKFSLKQHRLNLREYWVTSEKELEEDAGGQKNVLSRLVKVGDDPDKAIVQAISLMTVSTDSGG